MTHSKCRGLALLIYKHHELTCRVSLLTSFEEISDPYDWELGTHGLQVHFIYKSRGHSATFLPDVAMEQGWSKDDTLRHLFAKGGLDRSGTWQELQFDLERYESSKSSISFQKYQDRINDLAIAQHSRLRG